MKTILLLLISGFVFLFLSCNKNQEKIALNANKEQPTHSAVTPVPNPEKSIQDWWIPRQNAVNKRLDQGNVDLLFIGNSIINGFEGAGKEVWDSYYKSRNAVNLGFGWDRTEHVLWRLQNTDFSKIDPKCAVVLIGTNNIGRNSVNEIADGITAICDFLITHLTSTKVLLLGIFPRYEETSEDRKTIKEINAHISKLDDQKRIFYLDIGHVFIDEKGKISTEIMHDLLHPAGKGYKLFADAIEPKLKELMEE